MLTPTLKAECSAVSLPRILCVDDEPLTLALMETILSPGGYDIVLAANGTEALEKIRTEQIDICLLDIMMPGMDGFEVCRLIKSEEKQRNIPVVMITACEDKEKRLQGIEAGAEDYITKPFDNVEILARIKMLLKVKSICDQRVPYPVAIADDGGKGFFDDTGRLVVPHAVVDEENSTHTHAGNHLRNYARRVVEMEEELRIKLATELHDEIGRDLTVIGMNLAIINEAMADDAPINLKKMIQDAGKSIKEVSRSVRGIMSSLRPPVLDDFGLLSALRWHADHFSKRTGMSIHIEAEETFPRLKVENETALFRIAQEALMNAAKHADSPVVTIRLHNNENVIELAIADEGKGRATASSLHNQDGIGWGMKIMRERAELIGGHFFVVSIPEKGTVVSVLVPIDTTGTL